MMTALQVSERVRPIYTRFRHNLSLVTGNLETLREKYHKKAEGAGEGSKGNKKDMDMYTKFTEVLSVYAELADGEIMGLKSLYDAIQSGEAVEEQLQADFDQAVEELDKIVAVLYPIVAPARSKK